MAHELNIEVVEKTLPNIAIGNRIVNLEYVLDWALELQIQHYKRCTCGKLYLWKEVTDGLVSKLFFKCTMCNITIIKSTHDDDNTTHNSPRDCENKFPVNTGAVWGTLSTGSCHSHLEQLCTIMDIPPMSFRKFHKIEENLGNVL